MLASIGAVIPIVAVFYGSWVLAVQNEQERLADFAERVVTRASISVAGATDALTQMAVSKAIPCSDAHIGEMRVLVIDAPAIEEMGYFEHGMLKCTSWGRVDQPIRRTPGDYLAGNRMEITISMRPMVTGGRPKLAVQLGSYNALIEPSRFVDVIADDGIGFAIAGENGALVSQKDIRDPRLLATFKARPQTGLDQDNLFAVARGDGWTALAAEPRAEILANLRRQQMLLLPVGLFIAAFIVGVVVWASRKRLSPLAELSLAVQKREFIVHYQPIIELKTGVCVGAEALVRWRRPDGSLVRPDLFIPLAEESGLIMPITDQVVDCVIRDLGEALVADPSLHIAVNLAAEDIKSGRILSVLSRLLLGTGIQTNQIWLEATERGFMDIESARTTIVRAREMGHAVAIDDFGTGYSSLQYLQGLPLDALKIDKSFIDTIGLDTAKSLVAPHIIDMAKELNLFIVAEGVETRAQADYLADRDVDYGQGWLFSKALPADEFIIFYRERRTKRGASAGALKPVAA